MSATVFTAAATTGHSLSCSTHQHMSMTSECICARQFKRPRRLAPQQSFDAERREYLAEIGFLDVPGRHVATETDRGAA